MKIILVKSHILGVRQYVCTTPNGPYRLLSTSSTDLMGRVRRITPEEESNGVAAAICRSYASRSRTVQLVDVPPELEPPKTCDHVLGFAMVLNCEEGDSFVRRWVRSNEPAIDNDDWIRVFRHCPICGARLQPVPEVDFMD